MNVFIALKESHFWFLFVKTLTKNFNILSNADVDADADAVVTAIVQAS